MLDVLEQFSTCVVNAEGKYKSIQETLGFTISEQAVSNILIVDTSSYILTTLVKTSSASLCCVLEQDTLILA